MFIAMRLCDCEATPKGSNDAIQSIQIDILLDNQFHNWLEIQCILP